MARKRKTGSNSKSIEQYEHKDKQRPNNPPVGLVDARTDNGGQKKKKYQYDPHLDPQLQWAGKAEHTSFEVPTVSLHVHERIDPRRIIETVKMSPAGGGIGGGGRAGGGRQLSLFEEHKKPLREAIEFYKHKEDWSNRLVAGDSLLVMNSLLEKEGMGGKVQMVYFDPPYGIKYGSNFQPFVNKRDVKDGKDEDLTAEPEMIKAFRDTWELGIHSYLTYLRDRLLLVRELLHESGSVFVQISDENVHLVRNLMDEVFGVGNFVSTITFKKTAGRPTTGLMPISDYIIWYAKDNTKLKYRQLFINKPKASVMQVYNRILLQDGLSRALTQEEKSGETYLPLGELYTLADIFHQGATESGSFEFVYKGRRFSPPLGKHWKTSIEGLKRLEKNQWLEIAGDTLRYRRFLKDFPVSEITNNWIDVQGVMDRKYVVETNETVIQRCLLMTTDPGDLVLDITCGSGTTAYVAENWGRRWITCDTSRVAITLAKQRLMTAVFDYYELAHPYEGVGSGFKYKTVPHITLKSIANNEPSAQETLYDQPFIDSKRLRVTGPFTVEAVPAPVAKSFEEFESSPHPLQRGTNLPPAGDTNVPLTEGDSGGGLAADTSIARSGETLRQSNWRDELLRAGVRAKGGKLIEFTRVEPLSGTRYLQAEAETKLSPSGGGKGEEPKRVLVCFGPEHAPLEQRMVELALEEAMHLKPKPHIVLFCAFQFDEEAAKDIDETNWPGVTLLKAQMNADMLTDDLKKKRSSNESFWLIGQPDVILRKVSPSVVNKKKELSPSGGGKGKELYQVEVHGFDYYNPKTGTVESGGKGDIAMWMLDTDYDGRSLFPSQVFFPMAGDKEGWATLAKNLKAEIDKEKIETFRGTVSLPFTPGKAVAVKIIDARGIESLKIMRL
ncbi:MAG: site-specific DNA-methyltransferase [Candidatus Brocadia sp. AMX2]|uniref:site-specific DNA-methyltransferase n=1 Tax=Candidatus Brocadia sp. AMX2 TaxID=2293635 RepID=UPI000EF0AF03|nr:site-specific DNA-methyltransferase [Candidatus Brocadia sp. AMX2]MBC6932462.1 site-specific DNA-methyltransferase [Candidatus Brocadia sp.]KAA0245141.1 MAG: site-specific DNA-methyltransferase [Candidatus Brocadia sp. AMX2]MCE7866455.1 site-specific DNA-methyltransferase [Candidatus Brocadia sp. AMX2]MCQ3917238.1 site-specific DNA-methyltransferase [Candidatus Brocadia sp.]MDL1935486.1 site-specific DNA-methyltransferase [Candidatus Brocadia sp. AMX2]